MKRLRALRVALAAIFLVAAVLLVLSPYWHLAPQPLLKVVELLQVSPGVGYARNALALTIGVTLFWLMVTFFAGRVYCSTVCPIGTICDIFSWMGRRWPAVRSGKNPLRTDPRPYSFARSNSLGSSIFRVYCLTLIFAQLLFAFIIEPWAVWLNMMSMIFPQSVAKTWGYLGASAMVGFICGAVSLVALAVVSWKWGRAYCVNVCPIGTALGLATRYSPTMIAIDPDRCISCMKCEDACRSRCIKVVSRYVDNSRCVRCFDCLDVCPEKAISFTTNRHRPASPLLKKVSDPT